MAQWSFAALDEGGRRRRGTVEGDNARHVRSLLREQGLRPLNVRPAAPGIASRFRLGKRRALGSEALAQLTRQLATLLRGGLPLDAALNALAAQRARHGDDERRTDPWPHGAEIPGACRRVTKSGGRGRPEAYLAVVFLDVASATAPSAERRDT